MVVDKLVLRTSQTPRYGRLRDLGCSVTTKPRGGFYESQTQIFTPTKQKIIVHTNRDFSKIEWNPNRFTAFESSELLVGHLVNDFSEPVITEVHFNVDLYTKIFNDVKMRIKVPNTRCFLRVRRYDTLDHRSRSVTHVEFRERKYPETVYLGSKKGNQVVCYDKITYHQAFGHTSGAHRNQRTRVEIRLKKLPRILFSEARSIWPTYEPLERVQFKEIRLHTGVKRQHRPILETYRLRSSLTSPREAEKWLAENVFLGNEQRLKRILKSATVDVGPTYDLDRIFKNRLAQSFAAKPTNGEDLWLSPSISTTKTRSSHDIEKRRYDRKSNATSKKSKGSVHRTTGGMARMDEDPVHNP